MWLSVGIWVGIRLPATAVVQTSLFSCPVSLLLSTSKHLFEASIPRELLNLSVTPHNPESSAGRHTGRLRSSAQQLCPQPPTRRDSPVTALCSGAFTQPNALPGEPASACLSSRRSHRSRRLTSHALCKDFLVSSSPYSMPHVNRMLVNSCSVEPI